MPLQHYGVLKGRPVERRLGTGNSPHYQIRVVGAMETFRIAINVKSQLAPSELLYLMVERFEHHLTAVWEELDEGFRELARTPEGGGLDFIRGNLFDPRDMMPLPFNVPGPDNDLNEKLDSTVQRALGDESAVIYAFGEPWGPEPTTADKYFGFLPGRGIHDIHMNQGNSGRFASDDGVWQDGGLVFHFPEQGQWTAVFTAFQSQSWHTDDATGHTLPGGPEQPGTDDRPKKPDDQHLPTDDVPDGLVRIVGALVNPPESPERETVTLLNTSPAAVDLTGWKLADKQKATTALAGELAAGATVQVVVVKPMALSNKGGIITLLDGRGRKIDGVSYTKGQASAVGWTLKF